MALYIPLNIYTLFIRREERRTGKRGREVEEERGRRKQETRRRGEAARGREEERGVHAIVATQ